MKRKGAGDRPVELPCQVLEQAADAVLTLGFSELSEDLLEDNLAFDTQVELRESQATGVQGATRGSKSFGSLGARRMGLLLDHEACFEASKRLSGGQTGGGLCGG